MDPDGDPGTDDQADIINMSFGGYESDVLKDDFEDACNSAYGAGIVLVAASGNSHYDYS
jgi:subtilisin family serine protease